MIHLPDRLVAAAIGEMRRALAPGGLLLLSFHVGDGIIHRDELLGEEVDLDFHLLRIRDLIAICDEAGLSVEVSLERRPYLAVEAPTTRGYILARRPEASHG